MSPTRPSNGHAWRPVGKPRAAEQSFYAEQLPSIAGNDIAAVAWDESDQDTWESESFESTLSSIAAFDMDGALERMASGEKFLTPELSDSATMSSPPPSADDKLTSPCDDRPSGCYLGDEQASCSACLDSTSPRRQGIALPDAHKGSDTYSGSMAYQVCTPIHEPCMAACSNIKSSQGSRSYLHTDSGASQQGRLLPLPV